MVIINKTLTGLVKGPNDVNIGPSCTRTIVPRLPEDDGLSQLRLLFLDREYLKILALLAYGDILHE